MAVATVSIDLFLRDITSERIASHFQPIVDVLTGTIFGYEALARAEAPFQSPSELFARARDLGLTSELDRVCLSAAFRRVRVLSAARPECLWFVNISPETFCAAPGDGMTLDEEIRNHGVDPTRLVFEMTERDAILDYDRFQAAIRARAEAGFRVALDDFGSGHSGLLRLISCAPAMIKLDMELTRGVNAHVYKQNIVRSVVSLAAAVDAKLIAEGVESWQELEMLIRQGVRYAQGRLFADAAFVPPLVPVAVVADLRELVRRCSPMHGGMDEAVARLATPALALQRGGMSCASLEALFHADPKLDCVVVLDDQRPIGTITRAHLLAQMSGRFGYSLAEHKPIESLAKPLGLVVDRAASIVRLATVAMDRKPEDLYDPVVVVGEEGGAYHGIVTMRQLIVRSTELEVEQARQSNPLTGLPGNREIQSWIAEALRDEATVLYADLDRFKEFNDAFGFVRGDEAIRLTAHLLSSHLQDLHPQSRLGHLGGDDFVIVVPGVVAADALERLCRAFDRARRALFSEEVLLAGRFFAEDRRGAVLEIPLTTLSVAVIPSSNVGQMPHAALIAQIVASLKKKAKELSRECGESSYIIEQRMYRAMD